MTDTSPPKCYGVWFDHQEHQSGIVKCFREYSHASMESLAISYAHTSLLYDGQKHKTIRPQERVKRRN